VSFTCTMTMLSLLLLSLFLAAGCLARPMVAPRSSTVEVSVPVIAPPSSSPLASTLLSFSIEGDRWPEWSGTDARNDFTHAALARLADLTGTPPKIRVGANTADKTIWQPTTTVSMPYIGYDIT
jgi:hypothetical protein